MKKRRFALSAFLIISVVLAVILSSMPLGVFASNTSEPALSGKKLTASHAGQTLEAGEYYVEPGATLTLRGGSGKSGLKVAENSTVTIHVPAGSILNVYGGAANGTIGAGAGIEVGPTSNLKIIGSGTLNAYGGKAANGKNGANGETAVWGDDEDSYLPDSGYGGNGGGGAGAGIGTKGGNGGSGTGWQKAFRGQYTRWIDTDTFMDDNHYGNTGDSGKDGKSADACGGIFIQSSVKVNPVGGARGDYGGSGGSAGSRDYESDDHDMRGLAGGAGGGGGGAGKAGAKIGTGGGGGGGGGAGGSIGYAWSCWFVGGGGGGGGAGAVGGGGGAWSSDGAVPDHDCGKYDGGKQVSSLSGSSGGGLSGGLGGSGAKVKIRASKSTSSSWQTPYGGNGGRGGNAGKDLEEKIPQTLYTVSIDNGENIAVYYASANEFLPEKLDVQMRTGYTFDGYYGTDNVQYYDAEGNRTLAEITGDLTISARMNVNKYDYIVNRNPDSSDSSDAEPGGTKEYGDSITLNTPSRDGFLFRGWEISASNGNLNKDAYYTYSTVAPKMRLMMRSSNQSSNQSFVQSGDSFLTAGADKIGNSVTLYNLSADDGAKITIKEIWVKDHFEVTFKDFNGTVLDKQEGRFGTPVSVPFIPDNSNEYYTYTFKHWKCNIDGEYYTTLPDMGAFLHFESKLGDKIYTDVVFTAVYDIEYKKELHFVGSLGNVNLDKNDPEFPSGVLILGEGDTNVPVITNFKIERNDGVASLLLIPKYDTTVFNIKDIYINGQKVYYGGMSVNPTADSTTTEILDGFKVTITGNDTKTDMLKILLDNLNPDDSTNGDIFVQVVYEMGTAIGGRYEFGFITADYKNIDTDTHITHGNRSEAYGTYDPDKNADTNPWNFNELKITVDSTAINVVVRVNGKIEIADNQEFIYNGQQMTAADTTENILSALQYTYNGFAKKENNTLTIKWYDKDGKELTEAPKNVGVYQIGISAAQTTYYYAASEKRATFKINEYEIFVVAGDQTLEYTKDNIYINSGASQGGIFIKDADGNYIPVDEFVNSELVFSGVTLLDNYVDADIYFGAIKGILNGDNSNYHVNYVNGTLTITKAVNEWVGTISATGGEYSGQKFDKVIFDAKFGKDTAQIKYFYGFITNSDGSKTEIWKDEAPVNAGMYTVKIIIDETNNYSGLVIEVALIIEKKEIHVDGLTFEAIDKIYNGTAQYWSVDPNGDDKTTDAEVWLKDTDAQILQFVKFAGLVHPEAGGYTNAGTYSIKAVVQISNPNYTFITTVTYINEDGIEVTEERKVEESTLPVTVNIKKLNINVDMDDQDFVYSGIEPDVKQGKEYVTITPAGIVVGTEEFEALMAIIERDFFGGERVVYTSAIEYSSTAEYYYLDGDGYYLPITLTEDQFKANKALVGTEGYIDVYTKSIIQPETITLYKNKGFNAAAYAMYARLGDNSNYSIVAESGSFIILKKTLELPALGSVTYNGEEQTHSVADTELYTLQHNKYIDAGVYKVLVKLNDPDNFQWEVDGAQSTSDDQEVVWIINPKEITVTLPNAIKEYIYGVTCGKVEWNGNYKWEAEEPYSRDEILIAFEFNVADDWVLDAGTYGADDLRITVSGKGKDNYIVKHEGGLLTINKKPITRDELAAIIKSTVKYYNGSAISWGVGDFTIDQSFVNIIDLVSVGETDHVRANGIYDYEKDTFSYHTSNQKYFADVELSVLSNNYILEEDIVDGIVKIEVFIAKAQNSWDVAPSINANNLSQIITVADPKFGESTDVTVEYFTDKNCTSKITVSDMIAGENYYAKFTVIGSEDYFDLFKVIQFNSKIVTVTIPVVYLDDGTMEAGEEERKPYIGTAYRFECSENATSGSLYTYTFSGNSNLTNAGKYTITFTLNGENGQYKWEDGSTDPIVFTFIIERVNLTIKPDDFAITYKDVAPTYTLGATGLVNNEKLELLLGEVLYEKMTQFKCDYQNGSDAGTYDIFACNNDSDIQTEIINELENYNVIFENGTLSVTALKVIYDNFNTSDGNTLKDLISNGIGFVYDSESKEVIAENPFDELEVVIVYKDKNGNVLPEAQKPVNADKYKVEIAPRVRDGVAEGNYDLPEKAEIILTIDVAEITITVKDKKVDYNSKNYLDKFPMSSEDLYSITFTNGNEFTVVVGDLTIDNGEYIDAKDYLSVISINYTESENYIVTIVKGDLSILRVNNSWKDNLKTESDIVFDGDTVKTGVDYNSEPVFGMETIRYIFYVKDGDGWKEIAGAPTNAGEYAVEAYVPGNNNYYELTSELVEFTIQKVKITIDNIIFNDDTVYYNGKSHSIDAVENGTDLFNVTYSNNGKIDAGTYEVTATFTPKDTVNYEVNGEKSKVAYLTIKKVKITITAENKTSAFGDPIENLTYVIDFDGDDLYTSFYMDDWGSIVLGTTATDKSNVGDYKIISQTISNSNNYDVDFESGLYKITKFTRNTITVNAENVRYLMKLIYSAEALRGHDTIVFTFADSENGVYTEKLPSKVGTYYVKATIADTDNYNGVEGIASFKIDAATLSSITGITYNKDTATWIAVGTTTDGIEIDCDVSYMVGNLTLNSAEFKATAAGNFSVIAVPSDKHNYNNSAEVDLLTVFSVEFKDKVSNHDRQPAEAVLSSDAFAIQYRFAGQAVTRPSSIDSNAIPTIVGYTFREWMLGNSDYSFASSVNNNITLYADWTINTYTINFYNEVVTGSKIENDIFVEGEITTKLLGSRLFEYGDTIVFIDGIPTKAEDAIYTYTFAYWSDALRGSEVTNAYVVTDNDSLYAVYTSTAREFTITYKVSIDGGEYFVYKTETISYGTPLISLDDKNWFIGDTWYKDEGRSKSAPNFVPAADMSLYGAYVFDIGAGDVNADGEIDVDDITLYRRWIVGGYNIVSVAPGSEWEHSDSFDPDTIYFIERVNDANRDDSGDIRDITTVRMALTGGYGYTYVSGLDSLAGVTGEGVVIVDLELVRVDTPEFFKSALEKGGIIQITENITFNDTVTISEDTVIYLNGYNLDMSANLTRPFNMSSNARLLIYGADSTVKVGNYGLVNIPVGADNVDVVIHGGTYIADTDNGSFIKPRGEGAISIELKDVNLTDTSDRNFVIDASSYYGEKLSVNVEGGTYDVHAGFTFDGPATNEFVLNGVTINCRYVGIEGGGADSCEVEKAAHVTINSCNINLTADLSKDSYSAVMGVVMAGRGAQIEVNNSTLSSNIHIASICSGDGNCVIKIYDCTIVHNPVNQSYEAYKFHDEGSILFSHHVSTKEDLAAAFAVGGMIILEADIELDASLTVPAGKIVELDLNGHNISYTSDVAATSQAILNNGTLTICGEGAINYHSTGSDMSSMPGYATNAITNKGSLTIGTGVTVQNTSSGGASYAVDNDGYFHLDGGKIIAKITAVRVCNFNSSSAEVIVDSGLIEGNEGLRIQLPGSNANVAPKVEVTVNGGTLRSTQGTDGFAFLTYSFGNSYSNTTVTINGGEFYGWVTVGTGNSDPVNVAVNGGGFEYSGVYDYANGYFITIDGIVYPEYE